MLDWLDKELANQQKKVEESERALADYRDKQNALSLDDKQNIVLSRLNTLNDAVTKAKMERMQKETQYDQIKPLMRGGTAGPVSPDAIPIVVQSAQMQQLKGKLTELQQQKVQLSAKYGDKHPAILKVNAQLIDTQRQLDLETSKALQSIKNDYDTAVLERDARSPQNLEAAKADAQDLSRKSVDYNVMEREAKSNRAGLRVAAAAREGAPRLEQQPGEQRPRSSIAPRSRGRRSRRPAAGRG